MARPKKDKNLRHTRHIMLRLTNTEYEIIAENAKAASLPLAEYVRKQITNKTIIVKYEIVADTVTCILIVKNTSPEEVSERFTKKIIFYRYSRRTPAGNTQKSHILLTGQLQIFQNSQNRQFLSKLTKLHTLSFL